MVKVTGRIPRARCGSVGCDDGGRGRFGRLYDVRVHLKSGLCVLKAPLWLMRWGEGREAVICRHSYGNVLTAPGLAGQRVRRWLFGL